jgi:hypothetical protein
VQPYMSLLFSPWNHRRSSAHGQFCRARRAAARPDPDDVDPEVATVSAMRRLVRLRLASRWSQPPSPLGRVDATVSALRELVCLALTGGLL